MIARSFMHDDGIHNLVYRRHQLLVLRAAPGSKSTSYVGHLAALACSAIVAIAQASRPSANDHVHLFINMTHIISWAKFQTSIVSRIVATTMFNDHVTAYWRPLNASLTTSDHWRSAFTMCAHSATPTLDVSTTPTATIVASFGTPFVVQHCHCHSTLASSTPGQSTTSHAASPTGSCPAS